MALMTTDLERDSSVVSWVRDCKSVVKLACACTVVPWLFGMDPLYLYT